jgi:hypothetical protein
LWHCQTTKLLTVAKSCLDYTQEFKLEERIPSGIFNDQSVYTMLWNDQERFQIWSTIVKMYSPRVLTNPKDRLPAIAGIASELKKHWRDGYFFGTWRRLVIKLLAWVPDKNVRPSYGTPSWSWASPSSGRIQFETLLAEYVEDVSTLSMRQRNSEKLLLKGKVIARVPESRSKLLALDDAQTSYFLLGQTERDRAFCLRLRSNE